MLGIKIRGAWLDLGERAEISFELNNPIFLTGNFEIIPGSYSFPQTIPLSDHNRKILDWPAQLDNCNPLICDEPIEIYVDRPCLFEGLATLTCADEKSIKLAIKVNDLSKLKSINLRDLDLGGDRYIGNAVAQQQAHALDTADNPQDYDYIFFPVRNFRFWDGFTDPDVVFGGSINGYQNHFNIGTQQFTISNGHRTSMPFVKISYLFQQIFRHCGIYLDNLFQLDPELDNIVLYNNYSIYNYGGTLWNANINLANHVPDMSASDWLKEMARNFALAITNDPISGTFKMQPLDDIIKQDPAHDWTRYAGALPQRKPRSKIGTNFCFIEDDNDQKYEQQFYVSDPIFEDTLLDLQALAAASPGVYFISQMGAIYEKFISGATRFKYFWHPAIENSRDPRANKIELKCPPLFQRHDELEQLQHLPCIENLGTYEPRGWRHDFSCRLMHYKGRIPGAYPYASSQEWYRDEASGLPVDDQKLDNVSLTLHGQNGVFNKYWKDWLQVLEQADPVHWRFNLPIKELLKFQFCDIVRVNSLHYLATKLRITISHQGLKPIQAEMIRIC